MNIKSELGKLVFATYVSGISAAFAIFALLTLGSQSAVFGSSTQMKGIILAVSLTIAIITALWGRSIVSIISNEV